MKVLFGEGGAAATPRWVGSARDGERRGERRVKLRLAGALAGRDRAEHPLHTLDVSPAGARIATGAPLRAGEAVAMRIDHLGHIDAVVARAAEGGWALEFRMGAARRGRIADYLAFRVERTNPDPEAPQRRHERIVPLTSLAELEVAGETRIARIENVSASGAALATDLRPAVGAKVRAGSREAVVARHTATGIGVSFAVEIPAAEFGPEVRL